MRMRTKCLIWRILVPLAVCLLAGMIGASAIAADLPSPTPDAGSPRRGARPEIEPPDNGFVLPINEEKLVLTPGVSVGDGVPGGGVVVRELPSSSTPDALAWPREHIQGEFLQDQSEAEGDAGSLAIPPPESTVEPQIPTMDERSEGQSAAPGDFVRQFQAISNSGFIPPDTIHAVGPNHIVEAVNSGFAIYTKLGAQVQGYTTFDSFMHKPTGWQGFMFDPRVIYDWIHDVFVMLVLGRDDMNVQSYFWIAVSQTPDPTQGWCRWRFTATESGGGSAAWLDYAGVGADMWGVYVTGNYFFFSGGSRGSNLWSINPDIFSGCQSATNGWRFLDLKWPSGSSASLLQPAHPHSINSNQETYFVNTFNFSGNKALLWKLSGDRTSSPTLVRAEIGTAGYEAIGENIDQPGSTTDIDGGDARVMNAVYVNRRVFYTLTDDVDNDGSRAGWLTVKLNSDANTNVWQHTLVGNDGFYYFYPALTVHGGNRNGNIAVFGSWTDAETAVTGSTLYASGLYKIYTNHDTGGSAGPFVNMQSGLAPYVLLDTNDLNRWGDYSGASYDWECRHAWGAVETAGTNNRWRTYIGARSFENEPPCP